MQHKKLAKQPLDLISLTIPDTFFPLAKLAERYHLVRYSLPRYLKQESVSKMYRWAQKMVESCYFIDVKHCYLYTMQAQKTPPKLYEFDKERLDYERYTPDNLPLGHIEQAFIALRLLLTKFLIKGQNRYTPVANYYTGQSDFLIYGQPIQQQPNCYTVLQIGLYINPYGKNFYFRDSATTVKKIPYEAYKKNAKQLKKTAYVEKVHPDFGQYLTPISAKEDKVIKYVYIKLTNKDKPTKYTFHSIATLEAYEASRYYKLKKIFDHFCTYLEKEEKIIFTRNRLDVAQVVAEKKQSPIKSIAGEWLPAVLPTVQLHQLPLEDRKFSNEIVTYIQDHIQQQGIKVVKQSLPSVKTPVLFLMNFQKPEIPAETGKDDPYNLFKKEKNKAKIASQGLITLHFEEGKMKDEEKRRNIKMALFQLALKQVVTHGLPWPLHTELLKNSLFWHQDHLLSMQGSHIKIEEAPIDTLAQLVCSYIPLAEAKVAEAIARIKLPFQHPFNRDKQSKPTEKMIMFTPEAILEIVKTKERACFYDDVPFEKNLAAREALRDWDDFKIQKAPSSPEEEAQIAAYHEWLAGLKSEKRYTGISYEALYKTHKGTIRQLFNIKKETGFIKWLSLPLSGKKSHKTLAPYQGIWYDADRGYYYVGKRLAYKEKQENGFPLRRIIWHYGQLAPASFFPLLAIKFIRYKEYTVVPYPFTMIRYYHDLHKASNESN